MTICGVRFACVSEARRTESDIQHHRACGNSPCAVRKLQRANLVELGGVCRRRLALRSSYTLLKGRHPAAFQQTRALVARTCGRRNVTALLCGLYPSPRRRRTTLDTYGQHQSTVAFGQALVALNFSSVCVGPAKLPAGTFQDVDHCGGHDGVALATEMRAE